VTRGVAIVAIVSAALLVPVQALAMRIEVDARQMVTLSGASDSLHATVRELCERAGVTLRAFHAEDRAVSVEYEAVPLAEALARLLRSEVFIAGMRPAAGGERARVAWLHVSGSAGGVATAASVRAVDTPHERSIPVASGFDFGSNPRLVETALSSSDPTARGRARQAIFDEIGADPAALQRFALRDVDQVVEALVAYPHAAEFLRAVQTVTTNPDERGQIQSMIAKVQVRQAGD
jgi:hypothetical protein